MKKLFLTVLMSSFLVSSCTTTRYVDYSVSQDKVISFVSVKETKGDIPKDSLIMFGENLNYVIPPNDKVSLNSILNTHLSHKYEFSTNDGLKNNQVHVRVQDNNQFYTRFCLKYEIDTQHIDEKEKLTNLGFHETKPNELVYCPQIHGKIYAKNTQQTLPADYRLQKPIEIKLSMQKKELDTSSIMGVVVAPVVLPVFIVGGLVVLPVVAIMGEQW
ncbi:MAG: hypothetical protein IJV56_09000 [Neisseriaceae bacterium]|nr:hypothetical protein [Neisseriaceae bacterium]MBQ9725456.1 hypothetical protein [Neisseriaceae bacterium]